VGGALVLDGIFRPILDLVWTEVGRIVNENLQDLRVSVKPYWRAGEVLTERVREAVVDFMGDCKRLHLSQR